MKKKKKNAKKIFIIFLSIFIAAVVLMGIDFYQKVYTAYKNYPDAVIIEVKKGTSVSGIALQLSRENIIGSSLYFKIYYRLFFTQTSIKSGEYQFDRPMSMKEVIEMLTQGRVLLHKITIPEGLIIKEIAVLLKQMRGISSESFIKAADNVTLVRDLDAGADNLEGFLFPDTYHVRRDTNADEIVRMMVEKFKENFTDSMKWRAEKLGMSIRQVVTLASLIEKETSSREERFLISSVFHNRLKSGMTLGCDPTNIYALKRVGKYNGKLGWKDLKFDSPYNTRLYRGLPPGPICNPGYASIEAALFPENTQYLYFVAKNPQTHYFSKTLDEHNWAVRKFIINR
ncbi:MAG TPA: endolytic transglycosylase MltG [Candidatus Deferrimicrobium sp.]|nr:endolytic transglycosylase MltG [Candidatus Deferrimicrobium sp.]